MCMSEVISMTALNIYILWGHSCITLYDGLTDTSEDNDNALGGNECLGTTMMMRIGLH